jgi:energy-coupling factor transporter ATP-binding protein EcfA2
MSNLRTEERIDLLRDLAQMGSQGRAEGEDEGRLPKTFYPVTEHLRMLDPDVVLVVGPRGSGKTEIFRILTDAGLQQSISGLAEGVRLPPATGTEWLKGFPLGRDGFDAGGLRRFLGQEQEQGSGAMQGLWFAYLVRRVRDHLRGEATGLEPLLDAPGGAASQVYDAWQAAGDEPLLALDRLDQRLEREGRYLFIAYDDLDTLGGEDWEAMATGVRGLVAFWAAYARRWRRIRPKIFLRTDLFDRFAVSGGADLAKLAAGRVELIWSDRQLYAMLLRRIANTSERLADYAHSPKSSIDWREDSVLGLVPKLTRWTDAQPIIERMIGPYMGASNKKGLSYRWPLAHIRDGRGRAVPRPLVRLFEEAARIEADTPQAVAGMRLLHPTSLRKAIDRVSSEHVGHARNEWGWIDGVKQRLAGLQVPVERREVESHFAMEGTWSASASGSKPPFQDPREFLDYVVEVGILRQRPDGRIDAADLFLYGLGLRRKGGVRRR